MLEWTLWALVPVIAAATECDANEGRERQAAKPHEGVFFSSDFRGTPGEFANRRLSAEELRRQVESWRTTYQPVGALTPEQHAQFFDDGFVVVPDVIPHDALRDAISSVEGLVDSLANKLLAAGKIRETHASAAFDKRLTLLEAEFHHINVLLHKNGVLPEGIQRVWAHPSLLGIAEQAKFQDSAPTL